MRRWPSTLRSALAAAASAVAVLAFAMTGAAEEPKATERTFQVTRKAVEQALKELQPALSGRLPALEGFAAAGERPLSRYQRGFFQCTIQVVPAKPGSGESVVRVSTRITAWYADPTAAHSGYQVLKSNGRIEEDLLDQLSDRLGSGTLTASEKPATGGGDNKRATTEPTLSAPTPQRDAEAFRSTAAKGIAALASAQPSGSAKPGTRVASDLQAETASLEDVLKNQAHPKNLVAVKKTGTPVVASPSLTGKTLFLATAHDEFELLDYNADWVHVRVSGLSRGWVWRTSLEMPEGIPDVPLAGTNAPAAADLFQVSREETATFPGDWEPLRGKSVKIISVQKIRESDQGGGAPAKLAYARSLLDSNYAALAKSPELAGLVLIFDSADGGMIATTLATLERWKAGGLTDAALWHQCYFDPPETFTVSSAGGSR